MMVITENYAAQLFMYKYTVHNFKHLRKGTAALGLGVNGFSKTVRCQN